MKQFIQIVCIAQVSAILIATVTVGLFVLVFKLTGNL